MDIDHLRNHFTSTGFTKADLSNDPLEQFAIWFKQAVDIRLFEVNAMNLATVDQNGQPSIRAVLLKSYDERGFVFYTNYNSRKAKAIENNPKVALQFLWASLERQIRIEGLAEKTSIEESTRYFDSRPRDSRIGAWSSEQSKIIPSRSYLDEEFIKNFKKFDNQLIPLPPFWGGYRVKPISYEFWQGRHNRLSDRMLYIKEDGKWVKKRLSP